MDYIYSLLGYDKYKTLEDTIFNLKFTKKSLERDIKKSEIRVKTETLKVKDDIEKGDLVAARIHAENTIRHKNQRINYMKLSSKIDALICRLELSLKNGKLTDNIMNISYSLEKIQNDFSYNNVTDILCKFEEKFEDFDVMVGSMNNSIKETTSDQIPEDEVINLMKYVAEIHGLEVKKQFMDLDNYVHNLNIQTTYNKNQNNVVKNVISNNRLFDNSVE